MALNPESRTAAGPQSYRCFAAAEQSKAERSSSPFLENPEPRTDTRRTDNERAGGQEVSVHSLPLISSTRETGRGALWADSRQAALD